MKAPPSRRSELIVRSVALRHITGFLAAAEPDLPVFFRRVLDRGKARAAMGSVAKWLVFALPAGAPPIILARLDIDAVWRFLGDNWFRHVEFLPEFGLSRYTNCGSHLARDRDFS